MRSASAQRRLVREVAEGVMRGERPHLLGRRLGDLGAAVADVGEPEPGGRVEVLAPVASQTRGPRRGQDELRAVDGAHRCERVPEARASHTSRDSA